MLLLNIRWVCITALGVPVEPLVNKNFAISFPSVFAKSTFLLEYFWKISFITKLPGKGLFPTKIFSGLRENFRIAFLKISPLLANINPGLRISLTFSNLFKLSEYKEWAGDNAEKGIFEYKH